MVDAEEKSAFNDVIKKNKERQKESELQYQKYMASQSPHVTKINPNNIPEYFKQNNKWTVFFAPTGSFKDNGTFKKQNKYIRHYDGSTPKKDEPIKKGSFESVINTHQIDNQFIPAYWIDETDNLIFFDWDDPNTPTPTWDTYTEYSISGGYHVIGLYTDKTNPVGEIPGIPEIYSNKRWCCITGDIINNKNYLNDLTFIIQSVAPKRNNESNTGEKKAFEIKETPIVGQREPTLHKLVWSLAGRGLFQESITAACLVENKKFEHPHTDDEVKRIVAKSYEAYLLKSDKRKQEREQQKQQRAQEEIKKYGVSLDDSGNAIRMCSQYGKVIRHCEEWGKWFIWDGQRWKEDKNNTIYYFAKKVAKSIYNEASLCNDQKESLELSKWAHESSNNARINAMVESCKSEHDYGIPIMFDILDRDPMLFNVQNGTIDLRTFEKLPHDQINHITKISPVALDSEAKCPMWLSFLDRIFKNNPEKDKIIAFLKRACGYSLTGDTREQIMFFLYGSGANGKSTFIDVIQYIIGDYAAATESNTFTTARGDSIRNDIARLVGMRFVSASENSTESLLDESLVKKLTGNEKISARFLHHEYFDFYPEFKIWWGFNHQPYIRDNTNSIWRRILLIPFEEIIPEKEQDKKLSEKLRAEASGILNWMLDGLKEYYVMGINPPDTVKNATQEYREDQDILHDFIKECCVTNEDMKKEGTPISADLSIAAGILYSNYKSWYLFNGGAQKDLISLTKFGKLLIELGFTRDRKKTGKVYHGIGLKKQVAMQK